MLRRAQGNAGVPRRSLRPGAAGIAVLLVALDGGLRLLAGEPYRGATLLLVAACGCAVLPFLPTALWASTLRLALVPALGVGWLSILLTTVSLAGIPLTELSIRATLGASVVGLAVAAKLVAAGGQARRATSGRREALAAIGLAVVAAFTFASALDVVRPFPPPGGDWAAYLLYADEVESQEHLLIEDPYALGEARVFGNYPGNGAVYGSLRILDGVSSRSLATGIAAVSALLPLSVYAAVAGLWGAGAGLVAAAAYAVAPIRLEPLYWHGLATIFGLVFVPLTVLALGLAARGDRSWRTAALLGFSLASVLSAHTLTAVVVALLVATLLAFETAWALVSRRRRGTWRPVVIGSVVGGLLGAGVIAHLLRQAADRGPPVDFEYFAPGSIGLDTFVDYLGRPFLALAAFGAILLLSAEERRRDPALVPVAALAVAGLVASELWRVELAFDYRRAVYYVGFPLAALVGVGVLARRRYRLPLAVAALGIAYVAHVSVGLRLPQRLLDAPEASSRAVEAMESLRSTLPARAVLVADGCVGARVPYLVRRPTLIAAREWQLGFERLVPPARRAAAILAGGPRGRRLAAASGVAYAFADPRCTPDAEGRLGGRAVFRDDELVIVELPRTGASAARASDRA